MSADDAPVTPDEQSGGGTDGDRDGDDPTSFARTSLRDQAPAIVAGLVVGLVAYAVLGRLAWFPFSPQFAAIALALVVYLVLDARLLRRQG